MNDDYLRQFQETPPEDFGHSLLKRLKDMDRTSMNGHTSTTVHITNRPGVAPPHSESNGKRLLRIAALIVLLFGVYTSERLLNNHISDDVQVAVLSAPAIEPNGAPQQADMVITPENIGQLQEINRFGSGELIATRWSEDGSRMVAIGTNQLQIFDDHLVLLHSIETAVGRFVDASFINDSNALLIADADGTRIRHYHLDSESSEVVVTDANIFAADMYRQLVVAPSGEFFAYTTGIEGNVTLQSLTDDRIAVSPVAETVGMVMSFDAATTPPVPFEMLRFPAPPHAIAISPDSTMVAIYDSGARQLSVWDIQPNYTLAVRHRVSWFDAGSSDYARVQSLGVSFSPDSSHVLINTAGQVGVFDASTFNLIHQHRFAGTDSFTARFVSNDIVHINASSTVVRWLLEDDLRIPIGLASTLEGLNNNAYKVSFDPNGEKFVSQASGNRLVLWDMMTASDTAGVAEVSAAIYVSTGAFTDYDINNNGQIAAFQTWEASPDATPQEANVWLSQNGEDVQPLIALDTMPIQTIFSPDDRYLFVLTSMPGGVRNRVLYATRDINGNYSGFRSFYESELGERISELTFSIDGRKLYINGSRLRIIDISDQTPQFINSDIQIAEQLMASADTNSELRDSIHRLTQHPNREGYVAMAGNILNAWDATGNLLYSEYRREFNLLYLGYTTDGEHIVVTTRTDVLLFNVRTLEIDHMYSPPAETEDYLAGLTPIPGSNTFIIQASTGLYLWDYVSGEVTALPDHLLSPGSPLHLQFSTDVEQLYARWGDGTIRAFGLR